METAWETAGSHWVAAWGAPCRGSEWPPRGQPRSCRRFAAYGSTALCYVCCSQGECMWGPQRHEWCPAPSPCWGVHQPQSLTPQTPALPPCFRWPHWRCEGVAHPTDQDQTTNHATPAAATSGIAKGPAFAIAAPCPDFIRLNGRADCLAASFLPLKSLCVYVYMRLICMLLRFATSRLFSCMQLVTFAAQLGLQEPVAAARSRVAWHAGVVPDKGYLHPEQPMGCMPARAAGGWP